MPKDAQPVLYTDASDVGVAAVLGYPDTGHFVPCATFSRKLRSYELGYTTYKKELLAVVAALRHFHFEVIGRKVEVYTDHQALSGCINGDRDRTINQWTFFLSEYSFSVSHVAGKDNFLADALSRSSSFYPMAALGRQARQVASLTLSSQPSSSEESEEEDVMVFIDSCSDDEDLPPHPIRPVVVAPESTIPASVPPSDHAVVPPSESVAPATPVEDPDPRLRLRQAVLEHAHEATGHGNAQLMVSDISTAGLQWPGILKDALAFTSNCLPCLGFNAAHNTFAPSRSPLASMPWVAVQIDLTGPLTKTSTGHVFILVLVDVFTSFVVLKPLVDKTPASVAAALWEAFSVLGFPKVVHSDQGKEFINSTFTSLKGLTGFSRKFSAPYSPMSKGKVERMNFSAKNVIFKLAELSHLEWDALLPTAALMLNNRVSPSTLCKPFELMFGRALILPDSEHGESDFNCDVEALSNFWKKFHSTIAPAIAENSRRYRQQYSRVLNDRAASVEFDVGSTVLFRVHGRAKDAPRYSGFYTVVSVEGGGIRLKDRNDKILPRLFAPQNLKRAPPSAGSDLFTVDRILSSRPHGGSRQFRVSWVGYDKSHNSWVDERDIIDKNLIKEFEARGRSDSDSDSDVDA